MNDSGLGRSNGIVVGKVKSLDDPLRLGRVRVTFPHLDDIDSAWARTANIMAGPERGVLFRPEPGDEVLVAFEHKDIERPYILGGLWSEVDRPPEGAGGEAANDRRIIRSRSGHLVVLDDTEGAEKIELIDKDGKRRVVIDAAKARIEVSADEGNIAVKAAKGNVEVEAPDGEAKVEAKSIKARAKEGIEMKAKTVSIEADSTVTIKAAGQLVLQGSPVAIN